MNNDEGIWFPEQIVDPGATIAQPNPDRERLTPDGKSSADVPPKGDRLSEVLEMVRNGEEGFAEALFNAQGDARKEAYEIFRKATAPNNNFDGTPALMAETQKLLDQVIHIQDSLTDAQIKDSGKYWGLAKFAFHDSRALLDHAIVPLEDFATKNLEFQNRYHSLYEKFLQQESLPTDQQIALLREVRALIPQVESLAKLMDQILEKEEFQTALKVMFKENAPVDIDETGFNEEYDSERDDFYSSDEAEGQVPDKSSEIPSWVLDSMSSWQSVQLRYLQKFETSIKQTLGSGIDKLFEAESEPSDLSKWLIEDEASFTVAEAALKTKLAETQTQLDEAKANYQIWEQRQAKTPKFLSGLVEGRLKDATRTRSKLILQQEQELKQLHTMGKKRELQEFLPEAIEIKRLVTL